MNPERAAFEVVEKKGEQWFLSVIVDDVKRLRIANKADTILARNFIPCRRVKE